MEVCACKGAIHSPELWLRQCKDAVQPRDDALANLPARGLAPESLAPENLALEGSCAVGPCAGKSCAGGPCAGKPCAGEVLRRGPTGQGGGGMIANCQRYSVLSCSGVARQVQAERPQPREDTIAPRLRNKGSVSSGSAFLAARASISACSIIKFFSLV